MSKLGKKIVRLKDAGKSWEEIGLKLGISPGCAANSYKSIKPLPYPSSYRYYGLWWLDQFYEHL